MTFCRTIGIFLLLVGQSVAIINRDLMAIDVNDILSDKLMPLSLLYFKESTNSRNVSTEPVTSAKQLFRLNSTSDFNSAFDLMQFHRKMIQNYKCNNYIAKQILSDIAPLTLQNRLGMALNSTENAHAIQRHQTWNGNMDAALFDQGSSAYKSWLTKVALLDDVYKQIRANNVTASLMDESHQEGSHPPFRRIDATSVNGEEGEHEVGVASGYAIQHPIPSGFVPPQNHANEIDFDNSQRYSVAGNKAAAYVNNLNSLFEPNENHPQLPLEHSLHIPAHAIYDFRPNFYPLYTVPEPHFYPNVFINEHNDTSNDKKHKWWSFHGIKEKIKSFFKHHHKDKTQNQNSLNLLNNQQQQWPGYDYGMSYDSGGGGGGGGFGKEMTLKKVYELALTAIAYLAFGIFVLQVIMCITTVKAQSGSMMMMPEATEMIDMGEGRDSHFRRRKRSILMSSFSEINEISRKVLMSIDAAIVAPEDNGNCLKQVLCENSKVEKISDKKIWLPIWSLGMSWLSSRLANGRTDSPLMFECLKALTIGLGNGMCEQIFTCDVNIFRNSGKLKRPKPTAKTN